MATEQKNTRNLFSTIKDIMKETEKTATPNFEDLKRRMEERKEQTNEIAFNDVYDDSKYKITLTNGYYFYAPSLEEAKRTCIENYPGVNGRIALREGFTGEYSILHYENHKAVLTTIGKENGLNSNIVANEDKYKVTLENGVYFYAPSTEEAMKLCVNNYPDLNAKMELSDGSDMEKYNLRYIDNEQICFTQDSIDTYTGKADHASCIINTEYLLSNENSGATSKYVARLDNGNYFYAMSELGAMRMCATCYPGVNAKIELREGERKEYTSLQYSGNSLTMSKVDAVNKVEIASMTRPIDECTLKSAQADRIPDWDNCYVTSEGFCGLYNDGQVQNFDDCIKEIQNDLTDEILRGRSVYICREGEGPIAKCTISADNKLEVQYAEDAKVDSFEFSKEMSDHIDRMKDYYEKAQKIDYFSSPNKTTDDLTL